MAYRDTLTNRVNGLAYYEHRAVSAGTTGLDNETAHIFSMHANVQVARRWALSGRYAGKYKTMSGRNGNSRVAGHLLSGRITRDIGKRWDIGGAASMLADSVGQRKQAYGMEVGYLVKDDLWLSAGYNLTGFSDRDFAGMADTEKGFYFRMRYKFDENSF